MQRQVIRQEYGRVGIGVMQHVAMIDHLTAVLKKSPQIYSFERFVL